MPNVEEILGLESTSNFPTFNLSEYSSLIFSTEGAIILQGPHHSAQKSTNTGKSDFTTSSSKFESFNSITLLITILSFLYSHYLII